MLIITFGRLLKVFYLQKIYVCQKNKIMKILNQVCLFLFILCSLNILGQNKTIPNSIILKGVTDDSKLKYFETCILNASMESFRLKETDVVIKFKEGFECTLLSAKSLYIKGILVDPSNYQSKFNSEYRLPIFSISKSGSLLAEYSPVPSANSK
jgi:hypothetical protein